MLEQLQPYMLSHWDTLPQHQQRPRRLSFLAQATGVSKICFFVFADDDPTPCLVVKAPRTPHYNHHLDHEIRLLEDVRMAVPDALRATLPGPFHCLDLAGYRVVIEPALPGQPMDRSGQYTWGGRAGDRQRARAALARALHWLVQIQRAAPHRRGPLEAATIRQYLFEPLESLCCHADLTAGERAYVERLQGEAEALSGQDLPLYLYHGDFRAGNILVGPASLAVLDWEFSRPLGLPLLDWFSFAFRFYSQTLGLPDIDGPLEHYRTVFQRVFFDRNWFSTLVADYTRAACRALGISEVHLPLLVAMFVVTNINKFYGFLAGRAERSYLYLLQGAPTRGQSYKQQLRRQAYVWLLGDLAAHPDALTSWAQRRTRVVPAQVPGEYAHVLS